MKLCNQNSDHQNKTTAVESERRSSKQSNDRPNNRGIRALVVEAKQRGKYSPASANAAATSF